jgi:hypothetical protein
MLLCILVRLNAIGGHFGKYQTQGNRIKWRFYKDIGAAGLLSLIGGLMERNDETGTCASMIKFFVGSIWILRS